MNNIDLNYVKNNYLDVGSFLSSPNYDDESIKKEISSMFIKDNWDSLFLSPDFFLMMRLDAWVSILCEQ